VRTWGDETTTEEDSVTRVYFKVAPEPPRTRIVLQPVRTGPRPVVGVLVGAICALIGIIVGGALAAGGVSPGRAEAARPAAVALPVVTPIVVAPSPVPVPVPVAAAVPAPVAAAVPAPAPAAAAVPAPAPVAEPAPVAVPAPAAHHAHAHHHHDAAPADDEPAQPAAGRGTLAVTSKPPCTISIDGNATGLVTPQRELPLSVGTHEVTLLNADQGIQLTTEVTITADHTTQLIQDFTK
jgi:hypothetical protein